MANLILFFCISLMSVVQVELACWVESGDGNRCQHDGLILAPGEVYENKKGPRCYKCDCEKDGSLGCCDTGTVITKFPSGCKVIRVGCHDKVFNATDESKPCNGKISAVIG
ncbi:prostate-associated microseminoprotein-like [Ostrea edulis]|uniref:prostate-associated microseminoprotein-like n=1 Tax=Ostrea edulis TaxID=37623 RepID=UPI0024AEC173|nr:prostate-associated microseminoprotein-like [Ostrea edulis]